VLRKVVSASAQSKESYATYSRITDQTLLVALVACHLGYSLQDIFPQECPCVHAQIDKYAYHFCMVLMYTWQILHRTHVRLL